MQNTPFLVLRSSIIVFLSLFFTLLTSCSFHSQQQYSSPMHHSSSTSYLEGDGPPDEKIDVDNIPDAIPKLEPLSRYGNPAVYSALGKSFSVLKTSEGYKKEGLASWYGKKWHGKRTSSGENYHIAKMTAAHRTLPLFTYVRVTNLDNGKQVIVKVNDRGPFKDDRLIDLSYVAAAKLNILGKGTGHVLVEALNPNDNSTTLVKNELIHTAIANNNSVASTLAESSEKYLQLGSFNIKDNALALTKYIENITQKSPIISPIQIANQSYYQVKLGPFKEGENLEVMIEKIKNSGLTPVIVQHA